MNGTRLQESNVSNVSILKNAFGIMKKVTLREREREKMPGDIATKQNRRDILSPPMERSRETAVK